MKIPSVAERNTGCALLGSEDGPGQGKTTAILALRIKPLSRNERVRVHLGAGQRGAADPLQLLGATAVRLRIAAASFAGQGKRAGFPTSAMSRHAH